METIVKVCFYCKQPAEKCKCSIPSNRFIKVACDKVKIEPKNIWDRLFPKYYLIVKNPRYKYLEPRINKYSL